MKLATTTALIDVKIYVLNGLIMAIDYIQCS